MSDFTETCEQILDAILEGDRELAPADVQVAHTLASAIDSARVMIEAITLETKDTIAKLGPEMFLSNPEDVRNICGSLVTLRENSGVVVLAHFSVNGFFTSSNEATMRAALSTQGWQTSSSLRCVWPAQT